MIKKIFLFSTFILVFNLNAEIVESDTVADIQKYITNDNTLVVCDLDNTLIAQDLGSPQWFSYMIDKERAQGKSIREALDTVVPLYVKICKKMPMSLIEECCPACIKRLHDQGIPVIALTAREPELAQATIQGLHQLGITFSQKAFFNGALEIPLKLEYRCLYAHGIIFASDNNKGLTLIKFLQENNLHPEKIIFIDDKEKNLSDIEKALKTTNINFLGIRYNRLDEEVNNFSSEQAEQEISAFFALNS